MGILNLGTKSEKNHFEIHVNSDIVDFVPVKILGTLM